MRRYRPFLLLGLAAVIAFSTSSVAYRWLQSQSERTPREKEELLRGNLTKLASWVAPDIAYIKDPRTNLCFVLFQGEYPASARSLAGPVACDSIPTELLGVPK